MEKSYSDLSKKKMTDDDDDNDVYIYIYIHYVQKKTLTFLFFNNSVKC